MDSMRVNWVKIVQRLALVNPNATILCDLPNEDVLLFKMRPPPP